MKPKYICALSAIFAVVLFLSLASFMFLGEASYTRSPEIWYWTTMQNTSWVLISGGFLWTTYSITEEGTMINSGTGGTMLIPIYAVNPNPTLYIRTITDPTSGHLLIYGDGRVGKKQVANVSLYSVSSVVNNVLVVPTNLTRGYSTLNISGWQNGTQDDAALIAMWLG